MNFFRHPSFLSFFKALVFILLCWFIADRLFLQNDFKTQWRFFLENIKPQNFYLLLLAVLLMPVNWTLETLKWKILIQSKSSFRNLLKGIIAGVTLGFVTPARSGEFIGRVMYLDEDDKAKVFYLSSIGGIAQSVATLMAGVFFVALWRTDALLIGLTIGVGVSFMLVYFRFDFFNRFISSIPVFQKYNLVIDNDALPEIGVQLKVLLFSFVRLAVYLLQYVLLLMFFGVSDSFFALVVHTGVFLVALTFSPLLPFLDFSFRGSLALYIFSNFSNNIIGILSAVTFVWLLNLVLPAVIGYFFILKKKTFNTADTDFTN